VQFFVLAETSSPYPFRHTLIGNNRLINNRLAPVVTVHLVTPRQTFSPGFRFRETYGKLPFGKRHGIPDMFWIVRGMCIMASPAGTALNRFVHMNEMKVLITVAEIGHGCRSFLICQRLFVAHEAKLVIIRAVARIKKLREVLAQYPEIFGTVGVVAS